MSCFRFFLAVCVVLGLVLGPSAATAEPAQPASGQSGFRLQGCVLRGGPKDLTIGVVEQGAKVYPMERSAGWVNVYPESLVVMPPDSGGFWVRSEDLS